MFVLLFERRPINWGQKHYFSKFLKAILNLHVGGVSIKVVMSYNIKS